MRGRIKGKDKGAIDAFDAADGPVGEFLRECRTLPALRREVSRAAKRGRDYSEAVRHAEAKIADRLLEALEGQDAAFFTRIARRLQVEFRTPVDRVAHEIEGIWWVWRFGLEDGDFPAGRNRNAIPGPVFLQALRRCLPGHKFNSESVMRKARDCLGVVFPPVGRPRKS